MLSPARGSRACSSAGACTVAEVCTCSPPSDGQAAASRQLTGLPPSSKRSGSGDEGPEGPWAGSPCFAVFICGVGGAARAGAEWTHFPGAEHCSRPPAAAWPRWWTIPPVPDFLSRPDSSLFSSRLLSPPDTEREVWLQLRLGLIGSSEVEKAQEREGKRRRRRRERSSITVIIALMFIAARSSFALTLWKLGKLKIIKPIR